MMMTGAEPMNSITLPTANAAANASNMKSALANMRPETRANCPK